MRASEGRSITPIKGARVLVLLYDNVTTDHISPAAAIASNGPAGKYLQENGVEIRDFSSFGSRRGNDRVMATKGDGKVTSIPCVVRIDTPVEMQYYRNGGILNTVLRNLSS